jgi:DNA-directed RNA polymerase specialized sigma24 family protein
MAPSSIGLLDHLKAAGPEESDWNRLRGIYLPLISRWLRRVPALGAEADDLAQEFFVVVVREIPRFERQREGSFRAWLRQVTVNKIRSHRRKRNRRPIVGLDASAPIRNVYCVPLAIRPPMGVNCELQHPAELLSVAGISARGASQ